MSIINRIPKGFLDLLGSVTQGKTPPQYVDAVAPVVDIRALYLGQTMSTFGIDMPHSVAGNSFTISLDETETWLLRGLSVANLGLPLATAFERWEARAGPWPRIPINQNTAHSQTPRLWTSRTLSTTIVGQGDSDAVVFSQPIVIHPGTDITFGVIQRDAGGVRVSSAFALIELLRS